MIKEFIFSLKIELVNTSLIVIKHFRAAILCGILLMSTWSCKESEKEKEAEAEEMSMQHYAPSVNEVELEVLEVQPFQKELLANGKLEANQQSTLKFRVSGTLERLPIKNGDVVPKGKILAELDPFEYQQTLSNTEIDYTKAQLELEDMLVGRGYDLAERDSIPDNIYEMATIRSDMRRRKIN